MDQAWKYKQGYDVRLYETNADGVATVRTIANYMTDAAITHADSLGYDMQELRKQNIYWVLTHLYAKFYNFPKKGDPVEIYTWPSSVDRLFFRREFEVLSPSGEPYALAMSRWVLINIGTRKLERVPAPMITALTPKEPEFTIDEPSWKIPSLENGTEVGSFRVRLSDIDKNRHVSNVHYIDWVVESAACARENDARLKELEIIFKTEAVDRDKVLSRALNSDEKSYTHGLFRESDGQELIRARTLWE